MRSKANKFNNTFILVIPNKKIVVFDMTFHIILPLTLRLMRIKLSRKIFPICQFRYYSIKQINLIKVFTKILEVLFKLGCFTNLFHTYSIEAIKLSKLSIQTTPASLPSLASFIAAKVTEFGCSEEISSPASVLFTFNTLTP